MEKSLKEILETKFKGSVFIDEPLAGYTSLNVGGPADIFFIPDSVESLSEFLRLLRKYKISFIVLGNGSNVLFSDKGLRGAVISMSHQGFKRIEVESNCVRCGAGVLLSELSRKTESLGLSGCEFMAGIPGTAAGAVISNAGAFEQDTGKIIERVESLDFSSRRRVFQKNDLKFSYRYCSLSVCKLVIIGISFMLTQGNVVSVSRRVEEIKKRREEAFPELPNAGSIFKNPDSIPAWELIDESGLRNMRLGGARVSMKHSNMIVNEGKATSKDIRNLVEIIQIKVLEKFGIALEPEIRIVPEFLNAQ